MTRAKLIFIYTVLAVFVAIAATGILAAWGIIALPAATIASAFIGPCLGIVATMIQAKHIFDDPKAVKNLKEQQLDLQLQARASQAEHEAQIAKTHAEQIAQIRRTAAADLSKCQTENAQLKADLRKNQTEIQSYQRRINALTPTPPSPAPGSASTRR